MSIEQPARQVSIWLGLIYLLVLAMVVLGGITRLTGSGLSMVDWNPLMGALPPLGEEAWRETFARYQGSPQFQQVNHWMDLGDFQRIFLWEYCHRLLGRVVGLAAALPWIALVATGRLRGRLARRSALLPLGVAAQGLLGWYMVRSGLVGVPEVSHLRLAAHLALAFTIGHWALWLLLSTPPASARRAPRGAAWGLVALMAIQVVYGAFMAGTHAGWISPTFPDMNGHYLPGPFRSAGLLEDLIFNPGIIHYTHRLLAAIIAAWAAALLWRSWRAGVGRWLVAATGALTAVQIALGALTVVLGTPLWIAVLHQANSYLLFGAALALARR